MSIPNEKAVEKLVQEMGFNRTEVVMALRDTSGDVQRAVDKLVSGEYAPPPYTTTGASGPPYPTTGASGPPYPTTGAAGPPYTMGGAERQNFSYAPSGGRSENINENTYNTETQEERKLYPSMQNIISGFTKKSKIPDLTPENPTAPPLYQGIVDLPPCSSDSTDSSQLSSAPGMPKVDALPPPYEKFEKASKIQSWERDMNVEYLDIEPSNENNVGFSVASRSERCPVCFNAVVSATGAGGREEIVCHNGKIFHYTCFTKKHGPKCAYCYFPLAQADKDHELSGKYLVYKNKDYHVECYEKYAGPRCNACFNVIIEKPNGEFSGQWVVDNKQEFHVECLQKKLYATWRAKNT